MFYVFLFSLDYVQHMCDELKTDNFEIDKENNELRKREMDLRIDVENLSMSRENEVSKYLANNNINKLTDFRLYYY